MRLALILEVRVEKKASIHFQCFDPRTFSIPSIYPALSIKDAPRNSWFSLLPLPLIWDKKRWRRESRCDGKTKRGILEENLDETSRTSEVRERNYSGFDGLTLSSYSPVSWIGKVYSREIRLIIRLINWSASICRAYRSCSRFNWSLLVARFTLNVCLW